MTDDDRLGDLIYWPRHLREREIKLHGIMGGGQDEGDPRTSAVSVADRSERGVAGAGGGHAGEGPGASLQAREASDETRPAGVRAGRLIVFEGPDGVGKTTLARWLASRIGARYLASPGKERGYLGYHVYVFHHDPRYFGVERVDPTALQILHVAARVDMINQQIRPLLRAGRDVVLDRWWWSLLAYGKVYGVPLEVLESMVRLELAVWSEIRADVVFLVERGEPIDRDHQKHHHRALMMAYRDVMIEWQLLLHFPSVPSHSMVLINERLEDAQDTLRALYDR